MKSFIQKAKLETYHAAQEMLLLALALDRVIRQPGDVITSEATEIICRRLHGLELAFAGVRRAASQSAIRSSPAASRGSSGRRRFVGS